MLAQRVNKVAAKIPARLLRCLSILLFFFNLRTLKLECTHTQILVAVSALKRRAEREVSCEGGGGTVRAKEADYFRRFAFLR